MSVAETLRARYGDGRFNLVSIPRCPSSSWMSAMCTRRYVHVASAGHKCIVVQDEELIVPSLTAPLLHLSTSPVDLAAAGDGYKSEEDGEGSVGSGRSRYSSTTLNSAVFEARGRVDCMLVSSGKVCLVHRALLSQRSNVIRDLILEDTPTEEEEWLVQPTQLLLPELHRETASALVHFLYTDTLPTHCLKNVSLLHTLSHVGNSLRINRLKVLCENLLGTMAGLMATNEGRLTDDIVATEEVEYSDVHTMPPTTLARDLGNLIGDQQFADVRFIVEGRPIAAHRFILEHRSEFFRHLLNSSMTGGSGQGEDNPRVLDIVIPGSL